MLSKCLKKTGTKKIVTLTIKLQSDTEVSVHPEAHSNKLTVAGENLFHCKENSFRAETKW